MHASCVCVEKCCYFNFIRFPSIFHHFRSFSSQQPAAVEDLRKWTSYEAIGDVTVGCDGVSRVFLNSTMTEHETSEQQHDRPVSQDSTDAIRVMHESQHEDDKDSTLDYRLPSPEEQCQSLAAK